MEVLREMWVAGYSAQQIAVVLCFKGRRGTTRNSIISKKHRMGLEERPSDRRQVQATHTKKSRKKKKVTDISKKEHVGQKRTVALKDITPPDFKEKKQPAEKDLELAEIPTSPEKPGMREIKSEQCRFPIGDPRQEDFHLCGMTIVRHDRAPYCPEHLRIAYNPTS